MMLDRPALVLMHGVTMSESAWQEVTPLLASDFRTSRGTPWAVGSPRVGHVPMVDDPGPVAQTIRESTR